MNNPYEVYQRRLIYIFGIPDAAHEGLLKIGEATIKNLPPTKKNLERAAKARIDQYTRTAAIDYKLLHAELAVTDDGQAFRDYDVHLPKLKVARGANGSKSICKTRLKLSPPSSKARSSFRLKAFAKKLFSAPNKKTP